MIGDPVGRTPVLTPGCRRGITLHLLRLGEAEWTDRDQIVHMNIETVTETEIAITSRRGREGVEALVLRAGMWIRTFRAMGLSPADAMSGRETSGRGMRGRGMTDQEMIGQEMIGGDGMNAMTVATPLTESA
jgi:hypothetical protein